MTSTQQISGRPVAENKMQGQPAAARPWMRQVHGLGQTLDRINRITSNPQGATVGTAHDRNA